jgi:hypothetical protein
MTRGCLSYTRFSTTLTDATGTGAFCHAGISGGRRLGTLVGHDHETFSRTLKLKLRGNSCLIIIGMEGFGRARDSSAGLIIFID